MAAAEPVEQVRGRCLAGRYRLTELIGSGGAGNVWAATDEVLGRRVAVKDVGPPPWLGAEGARTLRERTLREAQASAAIGHPNVVTVYDVIEEDSRPWIVMELLEARTLSQIIDDEGPCPPQRVAQIGLQVLAALGAAHELGILHRDVKPSNVLVTEDGRAVLTDFGIATVDGDAALTASGVLLGAPSYIAPERANGGSASPASDLWSLGATLYTAVEGHPPYHRDSPISTIAAVVHEDPDPTSNAGELAPLLDALLGKDPLQRPNAAEVERFLRGLVVEESDVAESEVEEPEWGLVPGLGAEPAAADAVPDPPSPAPGQLTTPQPPAQQRRLPAVALLTAAATVLFAILALGYLARDTVEPGFPSQGPGPSSNEPAGPAPVLDVEAGASGSATGEPTALPHTAAVTTAAQPTGSRAAPGPPQPVVTSSSVVTTSASPPSTTTTAESSSTTTRNSQPSSTSAGATSPLGSPDRESSVPIQ